MGLETAAHLPDEPYADHAAQVAAYAKMAQAEHAHAYGGGIVYISPDGCRPHLYEASELAPHYDAYLACYGLACHLYPELAPEGEA